MLTLFASHDAALSALREQAGARGLHLDIRFMGSVDAIAALNAGRCMMAGFHTLEQPDSQSLTARSYRNLLKPGLHKLIGFAHRFAAGHSIRLTLATTDQTSFNNPVADAITITTGPGSTLTLPTGAD